jgi:dihydropteroate synthase
MPRVCEEYDVAVAKMASPPDLERPGAVEEVDDIYDALALNGFTDKTILDPAFGGWSEEKTTADDRETFHRLREFRGYGRPLLVSINRKNFLREVADRSTQEALPVSLAATSMAVERGAHVVRTHDVAETRDAALIGRAFRRERVRERGEVDVEELDVTTTGDAARHLDRVGADAATGAEGVLRTVELAGLAAEEREALDAAATEAGVTFVHATDPGRALLFGTPRGYARLQDAGRGTTPSLDAALERLPTA